MRCSFVEQIECFISQTDVSLSSFLSRNLCEVELQIQFISESDCYKNKKERLYITYFVCLFAVLENTLDTFLDQEYSSVFYSGNLITENKEVVNVFVLANF